MATDTANPPPLESATVQREAFSNGRYRVKRFLGEGGKKQVYLVSDTMLDRDVAFSLIKTEGLDETGVERIKREAQVMGRLGDHPHMVALYEIGEEDDRPYLVSQLMRGGDVEALINDTPGHRVPYSQTLQIADQVCQALEYAHSHGIIHRDLKPGNVWLTGDGTAKLGDFGLAMALDRTRLSTAGMIVGTVGYMPPEQAMGRESDNRSDLYSLGAMLYERVTGKQPFVGDDPVAVISQHLNTQPVAPSWHNPDIPRRLEHLILRLLDKDPDERPASATDVREELATIRQIVEQAQSGASSEDVSDEQPRNPLDRLAGGVFIGRDEELAQLRLAVDAAFSGIGQVVLVSGEPGIGKTMLVEEVSTYARLRGAQVLWSRNFEVAGRPAYWAWVQLIRDYVHERKPEQLQSELGSGAPVIAQVVSEIRRVLPDLPAGPDLSSEHARFQLFDSVATFLSNASRNQPLVLVLDDLNWADGPSLKLLEHVVREMRGSRLLVIGTYRDVEVGRHHPLASTLAELSRQQGVQRITLRGLSQEEVGRYIELTAGRRGSDDLVLSISQQTEGNPFFVAEIVRLLVTEGKLDEIRGTRWSVSLPQGVRDVVIGRRLDQLSEACNQALAAAAVIGWEFDLDLLATAMERDPNDVLELLDDALQARILRESDTLDQFRFGQAIIQEMLYEELSIAQRRRWNGRVARAIEYLRVDHLARYYAQLAHHYAAAGSRDDSDKAIDYARKAGDRAMEQGAWELAIRHFETAINILDVQPNPDPVLRCELLLGLGDAHNLSGRILPSRIPLPQIPEAEGKVPSPSFTHTGRAVFWAAADLARELDLPEHLARAALGVAGFNPAFGSGRADIDLLEEALERLPKSQGALRARLLARQSSEIRGSLYSRLVPKETDLELRSLRYAEEAEAVARELDEPTVLGDVLTTTFFWRYIEEKKSEEVIQREVAELLQIGAQTGDPRTRAWGLVFQSGIALARGDRETARIAARQLQQVALDWGLLWAGWANNWIQVGIALQLGQFREAGRLIEESYSKFPSQGTTTRLQEWELRWERDESERLVSLASEIQALRHSETPPLLFDLLARWATGDVQTVQQELADGAITDLLTHPTFARTVSRGAQLCYLAGDQDGASQLYSRLLDAWESIVVQTHDPDLTGGATAYYLGLLATTLEEFDSAEKHYEKALRLNTDWGIRPYIGHAQYAYADMLTRQGDPGDSEQALELAEQALALADELGMVRLEREALALKVRIQGILKA